MVLEKFSELISYLATCNGTCEEELLERVRAGELTSSEAAYVGIYAKMRRLSYRISKIDDDAQSLL